MQQVHLPLDEEYTSAQDTAAFDTAILDYIAHHSFVPDKRFLLKTESFVLSSAYANNKMLSLSNSRTRILPHQIESTYTVVNSLHKRFLIADEVGLGKTIEAGLIIKELSYRYNYDRVCIVCPASLQYQWQHEMKSKFNEDFTIVDKKIYTRYKGNPWVLNKIICSIDFIKNRSFIETLSKIQWDTVVIDEAHRLRRDAATQTKSYQVAEILAKNSKALLLLSATPFRGKLEELYYLLTLLDKNLLGPIHSFQATYCVPDADLAPLKEKIAQVVIRRTKREVGGFTKRLAKTIRFELYPEERMLYDATTQYVADQFNKAMQTENRAIGFVMTVFQKLLDSSSYALLCALKKRHEYLTGVLVQKKASMYDGSALDEDEIEDVDTVVQVESVELEDELATLSKLITMALDVTRNKKAEKLAQLVKKLKTQNHKKILIFTQFRTTQDYLAQVLKSYKVVLFHGSMSREEKEQAIECFKNEAEILICTEAGGEGRNLQFCNVLINYDLPWSPLKVEQRIGRIHRFGQPQNVIIYNFATKNTVAERVLEVLNHKLKLFEESLGTPDVILGDIADERFFNSIFMELIAGLKSKKRVTKDIETHIQKARSSYSKLQELTVATKIDLNFDEYYKITMQERAFSNKRIEQFISELKDVDDTISKCISGPNPKNRLYFVRYNPFTHAPVNRYGTFTSEVALENESLEFLAFGHPVVDFGIMQCQQHVFGGLAGIKQINCSYDCNGLIFHYLVTLKAKEEVQHFVPVFVSKDILNQSIIDDIEQEAMRQYGCAVNVADDVAGQYSGNIYYYYELSLKRLEKKVGAIVTEIKETMNLHIDPYMERVCQHYQQEKEYLHKRLEWQECQQKWYGKDMHSAITRTKNMIQKIEEEHRNRLKQYSGFTDVTWNASLVNAGILVCTPASF
ncbi:MAG: SNF2-related protein [Spirochaetota bacterium]